MQGNININLKSKFNFNDIFPSSAVHSLTHSSMPIAKGDSGATNHYFAPNDAKYLSSRKATTSGPTVQLPNAECITTTEQGTLPIVSNLPPTATTTFVLLKLQTSLISLGQLSDAGCHIFLDKTKLQVFHNFKQILLGHINKSNGLWDIPLLSNNRIVTQNTQIQCDNP